MSSLSRHAHLSSHKRYHPYITQQGKDQQQPLRRCRFQDTSVSPSPPPTFAPSELTLETIGTPKTKLIDYFSSLPQELIEEIGLLASLAPQSEFADPFTPALFREDRHRIRTLHALTLVSRQFNQIFSHPLYLQPLLIDTQFATTSQYPNSASKWLRPSTYRHSKHAERFTLWRPRISEDESDEQYSPPNHVMNSCMILFMLTNVRELTLAGDFGSEAKPKNAIGSWNTAIWGRTTLTPKHVPHLTSVRIVEVCDAELIDTILVGIARQLTSLVIQPAAEGNCQGYSPRTVCSTLRPIIENLHSLEYFTVTLPPMISGINHCNHGHKLVQKTLSALPTKERLKHLSISLPLFDCRSMQWPDEGYDTEDSSNDEDDDTSGRAIDHAWFWMALENFLLGFTSLEQFKFTGSHVPEEIRRKLQSSLPDTTTVSFQKAERIERAPPPPTTPTTPFPVLTQTLPVILPEEPVPVTPPTLEPLVWQPIPESTRTLELPEYVVDNSAFVVQEETQHAAWTQLVSVWNPQYTFQQFAYEPPTPLPPSDPSQFIFPPVSSFTTNYNDITSTSSLWQSHDNNIMANTTQYHDHQYPESSSSAFSSQPSIPYNPQSEEWEWFVKYGDQY